MGQVGLEWSVGGIAVDPPTMGVAAAQLTQSMASLAPASSGAATGSPVELPPRTPTVTNLLAA